MPKRLPKSQFHNKIKTEHTILPFFCDLLNQIASEDQVSRIIPGRIYNKASNNTQRFFRYSYDTESWMKYTMHDTKVTQELFIICPKEHSTQIQDKINKLIITL